MVKAFMPDTYVMGIDIASGFIEEAKRLRPEVDCFKVMDVRNLRFRPKGFDIAHTQGVLIHVPHEDIVKVIMGIMWLAKAAIFVESRGKETPGTLKYDPKIYWERRVGQDKPTPIDHNTQYYFSHNYDKICDKLRLKVKVLKKWGDEQRTKVYYVTKS